MRIGRYRTTRRLVYEAPEKKFDPCTVDADCPDKVAVKSNGMQVRLPNGSQVVLPWYYPNPSP